MGNERIEQLKSIADKISSSSTPEEQIALLTKGFELFSEETERLNKAYIKLGGQFHTVNQKLEESNKRLGNKVQELHVLTGYLDSILGHMAQGILFIDLEGNVTTYNREAELILEKPKDEILFQPFKDHFDEKIFGFSMKNAIQERWVPKTTYVTLTFSDGRTKALELDNTFIPPRTNLSAGAPHLDFTQGLIVLIRDISELRRLQTLAYRNERMQALGEMAAQVAHEIRNPLAGMKGFALLLKRDLAKQPEHVRFIDSILEGTATLERLVTQVLNYSRPIHPELKITHLANLLKEIGESLTAEGVFKDGIHFKLDAKKEILAPVDAGLMKSALRNLLINGIQAMPKGGTLTLRLDGDEGKGVIEVSDTGIGIPEEHLKKLFSPFFSTKANGNGLGLAEAHKVVRAHGGEITLESTVGKGTCFTIKLPLKM